jgi:RimJ/RimL family protein N-acetyltransferase
MVTATFWLGLEIKIPTISAMPSVFDPQPVLLTGQFVRLEPLSLNHAAALFKAAQEEDIWRLLSIPMFHSIAAVETWIDDALKEQAAGNAVPFATVRQSDGVAIGSTRFLDIRRPHRALEIGWTWLAVEAQRTAINTEAKFLMLRHAFERQGAIRVQLKTDERNERSRRAIARLGAVFEGILRNHMTRAYDGYVRNSAMFSITDLEWPTVKAGLQTKLLG